MRRTAALLMLALAASCTSAGQDVSTKQADRTDDTSVPTIVDDEPVPPTVSDPPLPDPTLPARVERGTLDWTACPTPSTTGVQIESATLTVPLDHGEPGGDRIEIAVARIRAAGTGDERIGSLVINPGGPGASGIETLPFVWLSMSDAITANFDLVGFDPRGVGASTALECDNDVDNAIALLGDGNRREWPAIVAADLARLDTCTAATMELARHVGTNNAARDLDVLRAALGDDGLTYVGYSYGTRLGATYAELFPERVRALVLDGGVKPVRSRAALDSEQGEGFDRALENFAAACDADTDCPLRELGPTLDVVAALVAEIADVGSFATDDPDRVLTPGELSLGIAAALYSSDTWQYLASALYTAETEQDGTLLQVLGDSLVGRRPDGTYDNSNIANRFINCADDPERVSTDEQFALADAAADRSAWFGDFLRASTGCLGVDPALDPIVVGPAAGAPPIVVVGNTGDPATPYEWSVELAASLDSAVLYTVEAEGHTAYGTIECVQPALDGYLVDLDPPPPGAQCSDNVDADFFVPADESELGQVIAFFDCLRANGADVPEVTEADLLADPTLETLFAEIDVGDASFLGAFAACQDLILDF